jgi:multidrug efflux pump subunit AcrA (membrane-fusion protein)
MKITDMHQPGPGRNSRKRRWATTAAAGIVIASVAVGGFLLLRHHSGQIPASSLPTPTASPGVTHVAASPASTNTASTDLEIDLTADDLRKAQIHTARIIQQTTETVLRVPGIVKLDEYHVVHVTPIADGIIRQVPVALGTHVRRGQTLAVIFSSELADAQTQYLAYAAELEAEHKKLERTQNLVRIGAASRQEEEEVFASHAAHEAHVRAAVERLKLLGAGDLQIAALNQAEKIESSFTVPAPIDGVVFARTANVGLVVNKSLELFTVADLTRIWVMASLNEKDFFAGACRLGGPHHHPCRCGTQLEWTRCLHRPASRSGYPDCAGAYRGCKLRSKFAHPNVRGCRFHFTGRYRISGAGDGGAIHWQPQVRVPSHQGQRRRILYADGAAWSRQQQLQPCFGRFKTERRGGHGGQFYSQSGRRAPAS